MIGVYNIASVATAYAQLCGTLAGFAFIALISMMIGELKVKETLPERGKMFLRLAEISILTFIGLIAACVLQTIRSGIIIDLSAFGYNRIPSIHDKSQLIFAHIITIFADVVMVGAILMLLSIFFIMVGIFLFENGIVLQKRMRKLFSISVVVALLFHQITVYNLLNVINVDFSTLEYILFSSSILIYFLTGYILDRFYILLSMKHVFFFAMTLIVSGCLIVMAVWSVISRETIDEYINVTLILVLILNTLLGIFARILYDQSVGNTDKDKARDDKFLERLIIN